MRRWIQLCELAYMLPNLSHCRIQGCTGISANLIAICYGWSQSIGKRLSGLHGVFTLDDDLLNYTQRLAALLQSCSLISI